jgi:hypothetical protein
MSSDTETSKESLYRKPDTVSITKAQVVIVTIDVIANIPYFLKYPAHLKKRPKIGGQLIIHPQTLVILLSFTI